LLNPVSQFPAADAGAETSPIAPIASAAVSAILYFIIILQLHCRDGA
jgi:hypothetical protein